MKLIFISAFLFGCFILLLAPAGQCLSPMVQFQDLIAGEGEPGFEDGPFYSAQFNQPLGLTFNSSASILYLADEGNNRIRVINYDKNNEVTTFTGTGAPGRNDGPCTLATFNQPAGLALLPNNQIAVNDFGNNLIRIVDLKTNMVSTLAGGGSTNLSDGEALKIKLSGLWNLTYFPSDQRLYFTEPDLGLLERLNLKTLQVETVLKNDPLVPNPAALCVFNEKLYLADRNLKQIYEIQLIDNKTGSISVPKDGQTFTSGQSQLQLHHVSLQLVGLANSIIALAGSGSSLYAYQADTHNPIMRIFPNSKSLCFASVWGFPLINPPPEQLGGNSFGSSLPNFQGVLPTDRVGFIADPNCGGRFVVTNPEANSLSSFRDLNSDDSIFKNGEDVVNSAGIHELEYPHTKPVHTFRILLVGRSYLYWVVNNQIFQQKDLQIMESSNLMITLAKRMELSLNTIAALDDGAYHYEVLNGGRHSGCNEVNIWSYYVVPDLVKKYDIDLVIIMADPNMGQSLQSYFECPLTSEGIPRELGDAEYVLIPNSDKFKDGPLHDFFKLCMDKKLLGVQSPTKWFPNLNAIRSDPETRERLIDIFGKPFKLLSQKLDSMKTSGGKSPRLEFCYFPIGHQFSANEYSKSDRIFFRGLCRNVGIPYFDVCDEFKTLGTTYFPYSLGHYTTDGMYLFSEVMVHKLLKDKKIPF